MFQIVFFYEIIVIGRLDLLNLVLTKGLAGQLLN